MVIVLMSNNETGKNHDIRTISEIAHANGALLICDATQAPGKIPINLTESRIDMMAFSAHKFFIPKAIGALYISKKNAAKPQSQIHGGGHQRNLRSRTLNVRGIIGMGKACEIARAEMHSDAIKVRELRGRLETELLKIE